jgi:hypothetical protein
MRPIRRRRQSRFEYPRPEAYPPGPRSCQCASISSEAASGVVAGFGELAKNDGAVSAISQRFPFTHHSEPFGREGFFDGTPLERGKWYFERVENVTGKRFDHLDPGSAPG